MSKGDYEVGYCKPPVETRFKKGQSGNLKGRPKKLRPPDHPIEASLKELVAIRTDRGVEQITQFEALMRGQIHNALMGKVQAVKKVVQACEDYGVFPEVFRPGGVIISPPDIGIREWLDTNPDLDAYAREQRAQQNKEHGGERPADPNSASEIVKRLLNAPLNIGSDEQPRFAPTLRVILLKLRQKALKDRHQPSMNYYAVLQVKYAGASAVDQALGYAVLPPGVPVEQLLAELEERDRNMVPPHRRHEDEAL